MAPCQCFYSLLSLCRIVEALIPCRRQSSFHLFSLQRYSLLRDHVLSQAALWVIEPPRNRNWSLCCLPLYGASTAALESDQAMSAQVRFSKWCTRIEQQRQVYELVILKSRTCRGPFAGSSGRSARRWQCWVCPGLQKRLQQKFCAWLDEMVGRMWVLCCQSILWRWTNFITKCTQDVTTLFVSNPYVLKVVRTAAVCFLLQDAEAFGSLWLSTLLEDLFCLILWME